MTTWFLNNGLTKDFLTTMTYQRKTI